MEPLLLDAGLDLGLRSTVDKTWLLELNKSDIYWVNCALSQTVALNRDSVLLDFECHPDHTNDFFNACEESILNVIGINRNVIVGETSDHQKRHVLKRLRKRFGRQCHALASFLFGEQKAENAFRDIADQILNFISALATTSNSITILVKNIEYCDEGTRQLLREITDRYRIPNIRVVATCCVGSNFDRSGLHPIPISDFSKCEDSVFASEDILKFLQDRFGLAEYSVQVLKVFSYLGWGTNQSWLKNQLRKLSDDGAQGFENFSTNQFAKSIRELVAAGIIRYASFVSTVSVSSYGYG